MSLSENLPTRSFGANRWLLLPLWLLNLLPSAVEYISMVCRCSRPALFGRFGCLYTIAETNCRIDLIKQSYLILDNMYKKCGLSKSKDWNYSYSYFATTR